MINSESRAELETRVHKALSTWHKDDALGNPLGTMKPVQQAGSIDYSDIRQATNQVLLSALGILRLNHEKDATLLLKRFVENKPSFVVANELSVAESTMYKMQRQAIRRLTAILLDMERKDETNRLSDFDSRIPPQSYNHLIGVDNQLDRLRKVLLTPEPPWLIVLTGLGGIGKTALAHAMYKHLILEAQVFCDFAWISAQQQFLDPVGLIRSVDQPSLTAADLTEMLAAQLLPTSVMPKPFSVNEALHGLLAVMRQTPHLVVVDNLETLCDLETLVPLLRRLAGPSKFLLTSREALYSEPDIHHFSVPELSKADALKLVRYEASIRNLPDVTAADDKTLSPIFETVGGNPLALKLIVGQLCYLSLDRVLQNLREAHGRKTEELYRYIYWDSWKQLSSEAQSVLLLMPLFSSNGTELINIERVSDVKSDGLLEALEQLASLSLVNISGDFRNRRYGIHRLTETFLLQEVITWATSENSKS